MYLYLASHMDGRGKISFRGHFLSNQNSMLIVDCGLCGGLVV